MIRLISGVFLLISSSFFVPVQGQIPNGSWREHFSYFRAKSLAITPKSVYFGANQGGMLKYDKESGELEKLSKITGLSDIFINALAYSETANVLVVAYESGNVDILTENGMVNIPDIERKPMTDSKKVNRIEIYNNYAFLACDFGIVVLDLEKNLVKDSYFFGPGGTSIQVNDVAIFKDTIFAATETGLYKASLKADNLLDNSFWTVDEETPDPTAKFNNTTGFGEKLMASYTNPETNNHELLYRENGVWKSVGYAPDNEIYSLDISNGQLAVSANDNVILYNGNLVKQSSIAISESFQFLTDENGISYSSSWGEGFLKIVSGETTRLAVNAPMFNPQGQVTTSDNHVWVTSGGPQRVWGEGGAYNYCDNSWNSLVSGWSGGLSDVGNLYKIVYHPANNNRIIASAFTYGFFDIEDRQVITEYRLENTPVFSRISNDVNIRPAGHDFDSKGNLWTVLNDISDPVFVLRNDTEWENPEILSSAIKENTKYKDLVVTRNDQIWILTNNRGIVVFKEESDGTILEKSFDIVNQDGESMNYAYCLAEDNDGSVWVGTNRGPVYYSEMYDIFDRETVTAYSIKLPRNDGTDGADYLLDYEAVNDIAVDGGNRKWLATESSGAFLVSDDGLKTIHQFTEDDDSKLISNNVISIGVQEKTGEVFFSTNKGLVSFMGTSTEGLDDFTDVYVYPNPVRPNYNGDITVTGLITDANVKITDISGNLVYETTSLGGQAIWDGKNFDGERVATGVYLVFMTNHDGSKTHVTKLVFIH